MPGTEQEPMANLEAGGQAVCAMAGGMWDAWHAVPTQPCCVTGRLVLKEGKSRHRQYWCP